MLAYTLPGFATSDHTKANAWALMRALGVTRGGDRHPPGRQADAGRSRPSLRAAASRSMTSPSRTCRPGLRTDYLFRLANQHGGLVVGTGDLSELGLGWCTYGVGDHMSHYNVNASVSKTLIQHLIRFVAGSGDVERADRATCSTRSSRRRFRRNWCRRPTARRSSRRSRSSAPTRCRISTCST